MNGRPVRVVVAEDPAGGTPLAQLLAAAPGIAVAATTGLGDVALGRLRRHEPDVLVVGVHGAPAAPLATVRRVMAAQPLPVVVCTHHAEALRDAALAAGAVACVDLPRASADPAPLLQTVRLMAEVKVVRRWERRAPAAPATARTPPLPAATGAQVVGIGTSTGGPAALRTILGGLPAQFPLPILVVQHIATGFLDGMCRWLSEASHLTVEVARHGERPRAGHAYLAPDHFHLGVAPDGTLLLAREPSPSALCPSVSFLFRSLADVYGPRAIGVLLTGMGKDGAQGLKLMKDRGAATIVQDRDSSVVHGMPGEAIALGAATWIVGAEEVAGTLCALVARDATHEGDKE